MGWFGIAQAIDARDADGLAEEMRPRNNPNTPESALAFAVDGLSDEQRQSARVWVDTWLRDPQHDCLRARGDRRWQNMCRLDMLAKARLDRQNEAV